MRELFTDLLDSYHRIRIQMIEADIRRLRSMWQTLTVAQRWVMQNDYAARMDQLYEARDRHLDKLSRRSVVVMR